MKLTFFYQNLLSFNLKRLKNKPLPVSFLSGKSTSKKKPARCLAGFFFDGYNVSVRCLNESAGGLATSSAVSGRCFSTGRRFAFNGFVVVNM